MCISSGIQDKIDPASWIARKHGWAGITNPANVIDTRVEGAIGIGDGRTETEKRAGRINRTPEAQRAVQQRFTGVSAHARNISRADNPPAPLGIAGRRNTS